MQSVAELVNDVLEPVIARRAGMTLDLLKAWSELAGPEFSRSTRPEKINWPRRAHEDDPFKPATLVIACDGSAALFFQHEQAAILERINIFFGFEAIGRIKIEQKPVKIETQSSIGKEETSLSSEDELRLEGMLDQIDDPELKDVLAKLGRGIISRDKKQSP